MRSGRRGERHAAAIGSSRHFTALRRRGARRPQRRTEARYADVVESASPATIAIASRKSCGVASRSCSGSDSRRR